MCQLCPLDNIVRFFGFLVVPRDDDFAFAAPTPFPLLTS